MTQFQLVCHPDTPCGALHSVCVEVTRSGERGVDLRYSAAGNVGDVLWPEPGAPARADDLWRHSCFEMFVRAGDAPAYREFNFATSRQWAAYAFTGYRSGMADLMLPADPRIDAEGEAILSVRCELDAALPLDAAWRIGLSAVIEEKNGTRSYWALKHPEGKPDFHHEDCFALELPAANRA